MDTWTPLTDPLCAGVRHSARGRKSVSSISVPYFSSQPTTYEVMEGQAVNLACRVSQLGDNTLIWKKDGRMISANEKLIR